MILATLKTDNLTFEAYGQTTGHALKALERGLFRHAIETGIKSDWYKPEDIETRFIELCRAYRNGERLRT